MQPTTPTQIELPSAPPTVGDLDVLALSASEWRIFDNRFSPDNALGLLGFVEETRNRFEVLQIGRPGEITRYGTLSQALDHFVRMPVAHS
ncbi:hypothetical protein [Salinibacterium sp. ZJ454]|uniref:hypothetical protein n=1 Tax=Salinibacterium sp. ZJ454 TaxID=2708339 RepID=UPI00141E5464|nr:hypothetical protein [Salinibacterium sp. ZJ454]